MGAQKALKRRPHAPNVLNKCVSVAISFLFTVTLFNPSVPARNEWGRAHGHSVM